MAASRMASSLLTDNSSAGGPPDQPTRIGAETGLVIYQVGNFSPRACKKLKFSTARSQNADLKHRTTFTTFPIIISRAAVLFSGKSDRKSTRLNSSHIPLSRM